MSIIRLTRATFFALAAVVCLVILAGGCATGPDIAPLPDFDFSFNPRG